MKRILTITLIAILILFGTQVSRCQIKNSEIALIAVCRGSYKLNETDAEITKKYFFLIEISLENHSKKSIEFLTFNCTPINNIIIDSKSLKICPNNCIQNTYFPVKLNPGQTFSIPVILRSGLEDADNEIRIGWAYLTEENTGNVDNYFNVLEEAHTSFKNVIWSNELRLDTLYGHPILIK